MQRGEGAGETDEMIESRWSKEVLGHEEEEREKSKAVANFFTKMSSKDTKI